MLKTLYTLKSGGARTVEEKTEGLGYYDEEVYAVF